MKNNLFTTIGAVAIMAIGVTACNSGSSGGSSTPFEALPAGTYSVTFSNESPAQCGNMSYESQLYSNGQGQVTRSPEDTSTAVSLNLLANPCVYINETDPVFGINFSETWSQCVLSNSILTATYHMSITGLGDLDASCNATITLTPLVQ